MTGAVDWDRSRVTVGLVGADRYAADITDPFGGGDDMPWPHRWAFAAPVSLDLAELPIGATVDTTLAAELTRDWHVCAGIWLLDARLVERRDGYWLEIVAAVDKNASDSWADSLKHDASEVVPRLAAHIRDREDQAVKKLATSVAEPVRS